MKCTLICNFDGLCEFGSLDVSIEWSEKIFDRWRRLRRRCCRFWLLFRLRRHGLPPTNKSDCLLSLFFSLTKQMKWDFEGFFFLLFFLRFSLVSLKWPLSNGPQTLKKKTVKACCNHGPESTICLNRSSEQNSF